MIGFLGALWCLALAKELWREAPLSRLLNQRSAAQPLSWLTAKRRAAFVQLILAAVLFVAARDLTAMPGSVELYIVLAANAAPVLGVLLAAVAVAAISRWKVALRANRTDLSYWQVRALDVSNRTFGKCARRRRGNLPSADNDDAAPEFVVAA